MSDSALHEAVPGARSAAARRQMNAWKAQGQVLLGVSTLLLPCRTSFMSMEHAM
jgi:hypothetical protein